MLARIQGIAGPFPRWMLLEGEEAPKYFTPEGFVYQRMEDDSGKWSCLLYYRYPREEKKMPN